VFVEQCWLLPVQLRLVFAVEAQQQGGEGEAPDPPAGLNAAVLQVLGELQHLQAGLGVVTQAQEAPQGEAELVQRAASDQHTHTTAGSHGEHTSSPPGRSLNEQQYLVLVLRSPLMNSISCEYMV